MPPHFRIQAGVALSWPGLARRHHDVVEAWWQLLAGLDGVREVHGHDELFQVQRTVLHEGTGRERRGRVRYMQ